MLNLSAELFKNLPGRDVQYQMAPDDRLDLLNKQPTNKNTRESAVLLLIYKKNNTPFSILTKRAEYNGHHSGQISFPGGKFEPFKDKTFLDTAIRETHEEIGIKIKKTNILGKLTPLYIPISNIMVYPYVAFCNNNLIFKADNKEVSRIIEYKLLDLLNPKTKKIDIIEKNGTKIKYPYFNINNQKVWGATAMILNEFIYLIND